MPLSMVNLKHQWISEALYIKYPKPIWPFGITWHPKMKENNGEVPQYYLEHSHEAIIPPRIKKLYILRWQGEKVSEDATVETASSEQGSLARTAEDSSVPRHGIPQTSIRGRFGNASINLMIKSTAAPHLI